MRYDFRTMLDRTGMDALAIDGLGMQDGFSPSLPRPGFDPIPMWVADMNFPTAPVIPEAIAKRVAHPAYGYFPVRKEYYDAIRFWQETRNGVTGLTDDCIGYENGVLGGLVSAVNVLCSRGGNILIHSPTYIGFTSCLENNGYHLVHSELKQDAAGVWRMDFADMEEKIRKNDIHCAVFCSPHNPCGRVWQRDELQQAYALFEKYQVRVISDEIWSDLILGTAKHIPSQSVSEYAKMNTVALYAPTKTFNLAGLVGSYHIIYDSLLRDRIKKESSLSHYNSVNLLSMYALIGAYSRQGAEWLDELRTVLAGNVNFVRNYFAERIRGVHFFVPEGTYLLFLDCTDWCRAHGKTIEFVEKAAWDVGVCVQSGRMFGGPCHLRMNVALPLLKVQEACRRLARYVFV